MLQKFTLFFLLLFLHSFSICSSQTITAQLLDLKKKPIEGVKVFYDNSTIAVYTGKDGKFEVKPLKERPTPPLVFYHPSYEIVEVPDVQDLKSVYYLKQKEAKQKPLAYSPMFERKAMDRAFFENFVGDYVKDKHTVILNKDAIDFRYDPITNKLTAYASEPVEIQNNELGYRILYYMENFEVEFSADTLHRDFVDYSFFNGYAHFKDIDSSLTKQRGKLYESTLNHFFRQMAKQDFNETKFRVVLYDDYKVNLKKLFDVVKLDNGLFKLQFKQEVATYQEDKEFYLNAKFYYQKQVLALVDFYKPYILVDAYGNIINTEDVVLDSKFSIRKWAHLLPIDYNYN